MTCKDKSGNSKDKRTMTTILSGFFLFACLFLGVLSVLFAFLLLLGSFSFRNVKIKIYVTKKVGSIWKRSHLNPEKGGKVVISFSSSKNIKGN